MKKLSRFVWLLIIIAVMVTACQPAAPAEEPEVEEPEVEEPEVEAGPPENANLADFTFVGDPDEVFDLNGWYDEVGVECDVTIRNAGAVKVPDDMTTELPKADGDYTIGFSVYYTVDEVGSMILDTMKAAAEESGVELLVNDANYDQSAQNQAIEQWILQEVDGVILAPCDFTGVRPPSMHLRKPVSRLLR